MKLYLVLLCFAAVHGDTGNISENLGIGFSAVQYFERHTRLYAGAFLKFEMVLTNLGGAYNSTSGIFTAPSDGHYVFTFFHGVTTAEDVGFFAYSNAPSLHVDVGTVVKFNVATNLGNAYDVTTGIFTAPSDGFYFFSLFTQAGNENSNMGIYVKGVATCSTGNKIHDQSGCTVFESLSRGDQVLVKAQVYGAWFVANHPNVGARTGFSGFRYQTNTTHSILEVFQERFNLYQTNLMQELDSYRTNLRQENEEYKATADEALAKVGDLTQELEKCKTRADEAWQLAHKTSVDNREIQKLLKAVVKEVNKILKQN